MTTEEVQSFARVNLGRKVRRVRDAAKGLEGTLNGCLSDAVPGAVQFVHVSTRYWAYPADLDPIDGLGPLKIPGLPAPQPTAERLGREPGPPYIAAWRKGGCVVCGAPDRGDSRWAHGHCWLNAVDDERDEEFIRAVDPTWSEPAKIVPAPVATVTIPRADLEIVAELLNRWVPLPGTDTQEERLVVKAWRVVKAALWPAKDNQ